MRKEDRTNDIIKHMMTEITIQMKNERTKGRQHYGRSKDNATETYKKLGSERQK